MKVGYIQLQVSTYWFTFSGFISSQLIAGLLGCSCISVLIGKYFSVSVLAPHLFITNKGNCLSHTYLYVIWSAQGISQCYHMKCQEVANNTKELYFGMSLNLSQRGGRKESICSFISIGQVQRQETSHRCIGAIITCIIHIGLSLNLRVFSFSL